MSRRHGDKFWAVSGGIRDWEESAEGKSGYQTAMPLLRHQKNDWSESSWIIMGYGIGQCRVDRTGDTDCSSSSCKVDVSFG